VFDSDQITHDVIQQLTRYFAQLVKTLLQDEANVAKLAAEDWDKLIYRLSPLKEEIQLLTRIANGDIPGDLADEDLMGEVADTIESVCRRLFTVPGSPRQLYDPGNVLGYAARTGDPAQPALAARGRSHQLYRSGRTAVAGR